MTNLPKSIQQHIASYTTEAGMQARKGDRFLGSGRGSISAEMRRCVCGLCVSTGNQPQTTCTLFEDDDSGARLVQRSQTELCKPVCVSKSSVSLLQRMIRSLLMGIAARRTSDEGFLRISLKRPYTRERGEQRYLFDIEFFDGTLQGACFVSLQASDANPQFQIQYRIGEPIDFATLLPLPTFQRLKAMLDRALIEGDGAAYSLVVVSDELPPRDFEWQGIQFRANGFGTFRARPLYLFLQASPSS